MSLEIVLGPMFSGKSSYALSYIRRQKSIGRKVIAIKPSLDNRYSENEEIVTHDQERIQCILWDVNEPISPSRVILDADCIVIEEGQFFKGLYNCVNYLLKGHGKNILIVGLDGDANQKVFEEMLHCIPLADKVTKRLALCRRCGDGTEAPFTRYTEYANRSGLQIDVGGSNKYEAVCLKHLVR